MARFSLLALCVISLALPSAAFGGTCALCRQALASGGNAGLIKGFYWSIVLIAGVPLAIMAVVAVIVWRHVRARRVLNRPTAVGGIVNA